jgi:hypothetical protein
MQKWNLRPSQKISVLSSASRACQAAPVQCHISNSTIGFNVMLQMMAARSGCDGTAPNTNPTQNHQRKMIG